MFSNNITFLDPHNSNKKYINIIIFLDRHRSVERGTRSNWPFRSQSTDRSLVRRSVHLLMSESNSNLSQMESEVIFY